MGCVSSLPEASAPRGSALSRAIKPHQLGDDALTDASTAEESEESYLEDPMDFLDSSSSTEISRSSSLADMLCDSSARGNLAEVQALLALGADVNQAKDANGPPLHWAARMGRSDVIQCLIAHGADLNCRNEHGYTALMIARDWSPLRSTVQQLQASGATAW